MADHRQPICSLTVRKPARPRPTKIEMFEADKFPAHLFVTALGAKVEKEQLSDFVRMRVNGKWIPKSRTLFTHDQALLFIKNTMMD